MIRFGSSRPAPDILSSGTVYELGRVEYSLLPENERTAVQLRLRDFLLATQGPMRFTLSVRAQERRLYLWLRDDPGNAEALAGLGARVLAVGPESPPALHAEIENPGLRRIAKGQGRIALSPRAETTSAGTQMSREHLRILEAGTGFRQLMAVEGYPAELDELTLERLWWHQSDVMVALRITPLPAAGAQRLIDRHLVRLHASSFLRSQRGHLPDVEAQRAQEDAETLRRAIVEGRERLLTVAWLVAAEGPDRSSCETRAAKLRELFAEMGFGLRVQLGLQRQAAKWLLPESAAAEPPARLMSASTLSCINLLPAAQPRVGGDGIGVHLRDGSRVERERTTSANPMAVVMGVPGHGKSAFAKAELLRVRPEALCVADPEDEYRPVLRALGGEVLDRLPEEGRQPLRFALNPRGSADAVGAAGDLASIAHWALRSADLLSGAFPLWLTLDEAHLWLASPAGRQSLVDLAKRARKRGLIVTLISQNVGDFAQSDAGRLVLANAGRIVLFHQQPTDLPTLGSLLHLSDRALDHLRVCRPGEALLLDEYGPLPLRVALTEEEFELVDTRPAFARRP
ncbi:MAG: type IV secretory system conjugative DNA transfer family protein [Thermaerobacter sp.]|nr:type IV secretory system conjugative DNA transfer family protein [Thermaerobacter sp.]